MCALCDSTAHLLTLSTDSFFRRPSGDDGKNSLGSSLTESAKIRFAAASAGVQGFFASSGKHQRRSSSSSPNKVYVSAKAPAMGTPGTTGTNSSNGSLLSQTSDPSQPTGSPGKPSHAHSHSAHNIHNTHGSHGTQAMSPYVSPRVDGLPTNPLSAPTSHNNLHTLLGQGHGQGHSSSTGNVRAHRRGSREFKDPKEFEGLINATFASIISPRDDGIANASSGSGVGVANAGHNGSFTKGHGNKAGGNNFFTPLEGEWGSKF